MYKFQSFPGVSSHSRISALFFFALLLGVAPASQARNTAVWNTDQLAERADVICNGVVEKVEATSKSVKLGDIRVIPTIARIKVLARAKGNAPDKLELGFPALDRDSIDGTIADMPHKIRLIPGKRYRFYLVKKKGAYAGVLAGEYDEGPTVVELGDNETDENPPLFKKEAVEIATSYYRKYLPTAKIIPEHISAGAWDSSGWEVRFWSRKPLDYPIFTCDATILVDAARSVAPQSAIGTAFPIRADKLDKTFIGRNVRMMVAPDGAGSGYYTVRGVIEKIDSKTVTGDFTWEADTRRNGRKPIPRKSIDSIQPLVDLR